MTDTTLFTDKNAAKIVGDVPTEAEFCRVLNFIRDNEALFNEAYQIMDLERQLELAIENNRGLHPTCGFEHAKFADCEYADSTGCVILYGEDWHGDQVCDSSEFRFDAADIVNYDEWKAKRLKRIRELEEERPRALAKHVEKERTRIEREQRAQYEELKRKFEGEKSEDGKSVDEKIEDEQ